MERYAKQQRRQYRMSIEMHDACPLCNALITFSMSGSTPIVCPFCKNQLVTGSSDPTGHHIYEIDPDINGGAFGVFHIHLIPPGTTVCVQCQQVYPEVFECCPKLVDLALAEYGHTSPNWSPKTHDRIVEFLKTNRTVVENTVQLRLLQARYGDLEPELADQIRFCVKSIGLLCEIPELED